MLHNSLVIVGGGPVGLAMALSLVEYGHFVTIIDSGKDKSSDGRVLALSYASQQFLEKINGWPDNATAINCVEISHSGLGISQIKADDLNLENLGCTVSYHALCDCLLGQIQHNDKIKMIIGDVSKIHDGNELVTIEYQQDGVAKIMTADWLLLAEGGGLLGKDTLRINHDYRQQALVAHIKTLMPHQNIAYERFGSLGPLVLLPYQDHYVVVWSLTTELAKNYAADPALFVSELENQFTQQLGGCRLLSKLHCFPLFLKQVRERVLRRAILVGNSAQLLHPVSAQGLNVGLRDVKLLSKLFSNYQSGTNLAMLKKYHQLRESDVNRLINFTHLLATKMEPQSRLLQHLRGAGIIGLSAMPKLQNTLAEHLIYGF